MSTAPGKMCFAAQPGTRIGLGIGGITYRHACARDGLLCSRPGQGVQPFRASCPKAR